MPIGIERRVQCLPVCAARFDAQPPTFDASHGLSVRMPFAQPSPRVYSSNNE